MPLDAPGSLSREAVADVVAFILRENGFPPGAADLPRAEPFDAKTYGLSFSKRQPQSGGDGQTGAG